MMYICQGLMDTKLAIVQTCMSLHRMIFAFAGTQPVQQHSTHVYIYCVSNKWMMP